MAIKGLVLLNKYEALCSEAEVSIDPFEVDERLHALVHAAYILAHYAALDEGVYPRAAVVR